MWDLAKNDITGTSDVYGGLHPIFIKNFQDSVFFWSFSSWTKRLLGNILLDRTDHLISISKVGTLVAYDFEVNYNSCYFWFIKHSCSWTSGHSYQMDMQLINSQPLQSLLCTSPASLFTCIKRLSDGTDGLSTGPWRTALGKKSRGGISKLCASQGNTRNNMLFRSKFQKHRDYWSF